MVGPMSLLTMGLGPIDQSSVSWPDGLAHYGLGLMHWLVMGLLFVAFRLMMHLGCIT